MEPVCVLACLHVHNLRVEKGREVLSEWNPSARRVADSVTKCFVCITKNFSDYSEELEKLLK